VIRFEHCLESIGLSNRYVPPGDRLDQNRLRSHDARLSDQFDGAPTKALLLLRCDVTSFRRSERKASNAAQPKRAPVPDVRQRKRRPVGGRSAS
jgi:hypothetical protein